MNEKSLLYLIIKNTKGVLAEITSVFTENQVNIEKLTISTFKIDTSLQKAVIYVTSTKENLEKTIEKLNSLDIIAKIENFKANSFIERELMIVKIKNDAPYLSTVMDLINDYNGNTILFKDNIVVFQFVNEEEKNNQLTKILEEISSEIEILKAGIVATSLES